MSGQQEFAAALLQPDRACPTGLKTWNRSDPSRRFDVYRNNVASSLIDALADTFAVVQALVGEEFFRAMARVFVLDSPPTSPLLVRFGEAYPDFIAGFAPAQSLPYLADLARLEWARVQAYHAADAPTITHDALAQAMRQPERVSDSVVNLHPSLQLLRSGYAVVSLWAAHQGVHEIGRVDPYLPEDALLLRRELEVQVVLLPAGVAAFVQAALDGLSLGQAAASVLQQHAEFDLSQSLALLLRLGAITALR
jgi:hypothetical protein